METGLARPRVIELCGTDPPRSGSGLATPGHSSSPPQSRPLWHKHPGSLCRQACDRRTELEHAHSPSDNRHLSAKGTRMRAYGSWQNHLTMHELGSRQRGPPSPHGPLPTKEESKEDALGGTVLSSVHDA